MRTAFIQSLIKLAEEDERITLIVGDLGFGVIEPFCERFPKQFLNAGVAEQNMTGIAAGMAMTGKIVFTYSIANFPVIRCLEQIRNDVCYHRANVKIVSVGGGFSYGPLGMSHHAIEDLAIMRAMPEMTVVAPGDPVETASATEAVADHDGPCYLRLGRAGDPVIHSSPISFQLGRAIMMRDGEDLTLISTGGMLEVAVWAAELLAESGIQVRVLSMHTLKPLDVRAVLAAAAETHAIATLEEHSLIGGLGSAVAEVLAESELRVLFRRIGLPSYACALIGSQEHLRAKHGLTGAELLNSLGTLLQASKTL